MAVNIRPGAGILESKSEPCVVHSLPCQIDFDGPAKVNEYFSTYVDKKILIDGEEVLEASFRGYPLLGKEIKVPEGYQGVVVNETKKPLTEAAQRNASVSKKYTSLTYWNWDSATSKNDPYQQVANWITLSEVKWKVENGRIIGRKGKMETPSRDSLKTEENALRLDNR
nr:EOG090X0IC1 [Sida crystallina]